MDIHQLLNLKNTEPPERVKTQYYKRLAILHPNSRLKGSNVEKFIELTSAYKQYLVGDDSLNCYRVCLDTDGTVICRCGGKYTISPGKFGRLDCDYCSCFIVIETAPKTINPAS